MDTLLLAGGRGMQHVLHQAPLLRWIRQQAKWVRRLGSVCTGAFLLAEVGLLDGRRATTHWASCAKLAQAYPKVRVEPDTLFVREGSLYTSAGVTAGMDLALALVEEDHGREVALQVARELVMFLQRPGGQSQFSSQLSVQLAERKPLSDLQSYILEHPQADLSVETLAHRVAMSPRNFARVFTQEVGRTPARFITSVRVEPRAASSRSPTTASKPSAPAAVSAPPSPCAAPSCAAWASPPASTATASTPAPPTGEPHDRAHLPVVARRR